MCHLLERRLRHLRLRLRLLVPPPPTRPGGLSRSGPVPPSPHTMRGAQGPGRPRRAHIQFKLGFSTKCCWRYLTGYCRYATTTLVTRRPADLDCCWLDHLCQRHGARHRPLSVRRAYVDRVVLWPKSRLARAASRLLAPRGEDGRLLGRGPGECAHQPGRGGPAQDVAQAGGRFVSNTLSSRTWIAPTGPRAKRPDPG